MKPRIESIKIRLEVDENPDTSWLGEYTDKQSEWAIARWCDKYVAEMDDEDFEDMPRRCREYLYFVPYAGGEAPGSEGYKKYGIQDYRRMEGLSRGDWHFLGVIAEAVVSFPVSTMMSDRRLERLTSGGLWGVESDSGDYIAEVARDQLGDLEGHLEVFGVDLSNFDELADEAMEKLEV